MIQPKRLIKFLIISVSIFSFVHVLTGAADIEFPKPLGYVSDYAQIISPAQNSRLTSLIEELERKTSVEIAVVTISTLEGIPIEEYAVKLFEQWGIGKKGKDNGVLILVAMKERKVRIEVGYGLEGTITDGMAGRIIREKTVPSFKKGDYGAGLFKAAITTANLIAENYGIELASLRDFSAGDCEISKSSPYHGLLVIYFLYFLFLFLSGLDFFSFPCF